LEQRNEPIERAKAALDDLDTHIRSRESLARARKEF